MEAHDRTVFQWFNRIKTRQLTLPRFQRGQAWGNNQVSDLLTTVLRGLPCGATLVLQVGDVEKFQSRTMIDAPTSGERVNEQLLDGQQRLTALWRSLNDKYSDRTYFVYYEDDPNNPGNRLPTVFGQARWVKNGCRYPMWADNPKQCWEKGYVPFYLLNPLGNDADKWIMEVIPATDADKFSTFTQINRQIQDLRTKVREFNIPYLALPVETPKAVALDVFVKMNTSFVRLSQYDITVALVEEETGQSLREHVQNLAEAVPRISQYSELSDLILSVTALRQNRVPSQAGFKALDFPRMINEWPILINSLAGMVQFLEEEGIFGSQTLPSYTALPVIAASWEQLPVQPDRLGNARRILRKYLWRASLTSRYEQSSTTNALQDYRGLKELLEGSRVEDEVPIFKTDLPAEGELVNAEWPRRMTILGRGVLCLQLKCGALDIADGVPASVHSITSKQNPREYHHLFPDQLLSEEAHLEDDKINLSLNCALITWRTNRTLTNKDPIHYLKERAESNDLGEDDLRQRLKTHLIPYNELAVGGYYQLDDPKLREESIRRDYQAFLEARAAIVGKAIQLVCSGQPIDLNHIFT
jgi:hypothetical protein